MPFNKSHLKRHLEELYRTYDLEFLSSDPLEFVHMFKSPGDQEVTGLISSSLAYGRVDGIKRAVDRIMDVMGWEPYRFVRNFSPARDSKKFSGFVYRFNDGADISCLLYFIRQMIEERGSIGGFFLKGYCQEAKNIKNALSDFSRNVLSLDSGPIYNRKTLPSKAGVRFFFPDPLSNSPCKRLNLFLRWMIRRGDSLDFGLWKEVDPSKLVIPLDTHIARISRNIGLTRRGTADWKMAEEVTETLKLLDPSDPVKYDFSLTRLGILDKCPSRMDTDKCTICSIKKICVL